MSTPAPRVGNASVIRHVFRVFCTMAGRRTRMRPPAFYSFWEKPGLADGYHRSAGLYHISAVYHNSRYRTGNRSNNLRLHLHCFHNDYRLSSGNSVSNLNLYAKDLSASARQQRFRLPELPREPVREREPVQEPEPVPVRAQEPELPREPEPVPLPVLRSEPELPPGLLCQGDGNRLLSRFRSRTSFRLKLQHIS